MRRIYTLLLLLLIFSTAFSQTRNPKRGLGYGQHSESDMAVLSQGISWWYNWWIQPDNSSIMSVYRNYNMEFVPMAWNGGFNKEGIRQYLNTHPDVKFILGFNEPNFTNQANMTPAQAALRWSELEAIAREYNLKIVGPAVNYAPSEGAVTEIVNGETIRYTDPVRYLDDFFKTCPTCKVDYIALHCYMNSASALQWYIGQFKKYGRPIWLTEFCAWEGQVSESEQRNFMKSALAYLDNDPDVFRYAWFTGRSNGNPYNSLLSASGQLTDLGKIYMGMPDEIKNGVTLQVIDKTKGLVTNSSHFPDMSVYTWLGNTSNWQAISNNGTWWTGMYTGLPGGKLEKTADAWIWSFTFEPEYPKTYNWNPGVFRDVARTENSLKGMHVNRNLSFSIDNTGRLSGETKLIIESASLATVGTESRSILTGTETLSIPSDIVLYPNPVIDILEIKCPAKVKSMRVIDIAGREVISALDTNFLSLSFLKPGIYILHLTLADGQQEFKRFIKSEQQ
jgi:hypothetical protein